MTPKLLSAEALREAFLVLEDGISEDDRQAVGQEVRAHIAALEADNAALLKEADGQCEACAGQGTVDAEVPDGRVLACRPCALCADRRKHPGARLLTEHAKALEAAAFPCCGGSDERPPAHTQDCPVIVRARNGGLEKSRARVVDMAEHAVPKSVTHRVADELSAMKEPES